MLCIAGTIVHVRKRLHESNVYENAQKTPLTQCSTYLEHIKSNEEYLLSHVNKRQIMSVFLELILNAQVDLLPRLLRWKSVRP